MNCDGRGTGNGCYLSGALAAGLEAPNRAVKNYKVGDICGAAVAVAIHLREPDFLELANQVFIKYNLEFSRQLDFVRLNHFDLNRRRVDLDGLGFFGQQRVRNEKKSGDEKPNTRVQNALHYFCSLLGEGLEELATGEAVGSGGAVVWAPCATRSFLIISAVPTGIVQFSPSEKLTAHAIEIGGSRTLLEACFRTSVTGSGWLNLLLH